jgi:hypothetical protein
LFFGHIEGEVAELISEPRTRRTRRFQATVEASHFFAASIKKEAELPYEMRIRI